jgi:hypothetical protein
MRPQPCVRNKKAHKHSHHGHTGGTRHSPRNGFNGFLRALPGESGFLATVIGGHLHQLDASVEASGPHDFAVRLMAPLVLLRQSVHRIPLPTSVTIAKRPSSGGGTAGDIWLIWGGGEAENFSAGDWTTQISLNLFNKFPRARKRRRPVGANSLVSRTRCSASSAVHRRAGTRFRWAPDQQRIAESALRSIRGTPNFKPPLPPPSAAPGFARS